MAGSNLRAFNLKSQNSDQVAMALKAIACRKSPYGPRDQNGEGTMSIVFATLIQLGRRPSPFVGGEVSRPHEEKI
jgi:hypothetical protein